jgi:hypothetical protein
MYAMLIMYWRHVEMTSNEIERIYGKYGRNKRHKEIA